VKAVLARADDSQRQHAPRINRSLPAEISHSCAGGVAHCACLPQTIERIFFIAACAIARAGRTLCSGTPPTGGSSISMLIARSCVELKVVAARRLTRRRHRPQHHVVVDALLFRPALLKLVQSCHEPVDNLLVHFGLRHLLLRHIQAEPLGDL